jgi:hypothetical protein
MPEEATMNTNTTKHDPLLRNAVATKRTYGPTAAPVDGTAFLKSQVRIKAAFDTQQAAKKVKRDEQQAKVATSHLTQAVLTPEMAEALAK